MTPRGKDAKLHPQCYVYVEATDSSAPHMHRGKKLRIRLTQNQVEIFLNGERLAPGHRTSDHATTPTVVFSLA